MSMPNRRLSITTRKRCHSHATVAEEKLVKILSNGPISPPIECPQPEIAISL
jgi:hypothetical protein